MSPLPVATLGFRSYQQLRATYGGLHKIKEVLRYATLQSDCYGNGRHGDAGSW